MECLYNNGVYADHYNINRTPLEASIARYESNLKRLEKITNEHYEKQADLSEVQRKKRAAEKKEANAFLEREKQKLLVMGQVYYGLEKYREEGMKAVTSSSTEKAKTITALTQEEHHPTKKLEENMRAEGVPKPTPYHSAHHICPGSGRFLKPEIMIARVHMHTKGIRINDPANGVYLLTKDTSTPHYTMPASRGHLKYHTIEYEELVARRITGLKTHDSIKTNLQVIGRLLQQNEPKTAFGKIREL